MIRAIYAVILVTLIVFSKVDAQLVKMVPLYEEYSYWNPAAFSPNGLFSASVNYTRTNIGLPDAPTSMYASFHYPIIFQKMALGGSLEKQDYADFSQTTLSSAFRYKLQLKEQMNLSGGIGASLLYGRFAQSNFDARDTGDPLLNSDDNTSFNYNISAGVLLRYSLSTGFASTEQVHRFLGGLSMKQILGKEDFIHGENYRIFRNTHYYLLLAYSYPFSEDIIPSLYMTSSINFDQPLSFAFVFNTNFYKQFETDIGLETSGKILLGFGIAIPEINQDDIIKLKLGASYDYRGFINGARTGVNLSVFYTYDYDKTSFEL